MLMPMHAFHKLASRMFCHETLMLPNCPWHAQSFCTLLVEFLGWATNHAPGVVLRNVAAQHSNSCVWGLLWKEPWLKDTSVQNSCMNHLSNWCTILFCLRQDISISLCLQPMVNAWSSQGVRRRNQFPVIFTTELACTLQLVMCVHGE